MVEVGTAHPPSCGGLLGFDRVIRGDQGRQVLLLADLRDLVGVVQRPVGVRAQVDQQAAVDEPTHHERRHARLLAVRGRLRGAKGVGDPVRRRAAGDRRDGAAGGGGACSRLRGGRDRRAAPAIGPAAGRDGSRRHSGAVLRALSPTKG
ncbi:hypothetical protein [Streptomyces sp. NPDC048516]|uniref:hypothetical protein n=1 Tax=Streptomyces sp. NPDC048516 TaxID=3365565 RepID=UPI00371733FA